MFSLHVLAYARLGRTSLNGTIPTEVGRLSELQEFWVHKSSISGAIPSEFGVLSGMKDLRLQLSRITGTIPDEIYEMSQLKRLDLWQTGEGLTGTISPKIGQLAESLVTLRLQNNSFTGTLPTELALLTRLETLFIESNELEGIVPAVMCDAVLGRGSNLTDNGGGAYIVADCLPPSNNDTTNATFVDCELGCCAICCNPASQICNGITM